MAYVCAACGPCLKSRVGSEMRVAHTDENGWITHGTICATCIRHSWRDHVKLENTPKGMVEIDMQCKEFVAKLIEELVRRWNIPTGRLWVGY